KAGYIDARPHIRQLDEVLLQRTAGPYIGSASETIGAILCWMSALPPTADKTGMSALLPKADICIAANLLFITPQLCLRAGQAVCGASPDRKRPRAPFGSTQGRKQ